MSYIHVHAYFLRAYMCAYGRSFFCHEAMLETASPFGVINSRTILTFKKANHEKRNQNYQNKNAVRNRSCKIWTSCLQNNSVTYQVKQFKKLNKMKNAKIKIRVQRFGNVIVTQYIQNKVIIKTEVNHL